MSRRVAIYLTHPEVAIDPAVPVPDWGLSQVGRARHVALNDRLGPVGSVWSSAERKAIDGAQILAEARGLVPQVRDALHENDRSATGYLPPDEFEATADAFFATPDISVRGWERAVDAQARVIAALRAIVAEASAGDIAVVAHGGIGALTRAHVAGAPISRVHDQPPGSGGGNALAIGLPEEGSGWTLLRDWQPIDRW